MTDIQDFMPEQASGVPGTVPETASLRRQGVLVLGMHRSGTSALSGVLAKLGCALPTDLMGASVGNEKGHWEPQGIVHLNDEILDSAGSHWEDWARFNPDWYNSPLYPSFFRNARKRLQVSFGDEPLFVLKDPRICRLARFWIEAMEAEDIDPLFVMCLRDPVEVAYSLARRDGMEKDYAALLWLRHMLEAESTTRGRLRTFCSYAQLLGDWRSTTDRVAAGLDISWPRKSARTAAQISEFLAPDERVASVQSSASLPEWAGQAYEIFERWARKGEDEADHVRLDAIMAEFDKASDIFAALILPGSHSLGAGGVKAMREDFDREIEARDARVEALEMEAAQMKAVVDEAMANAAHEAAQHPDGSGARVTELEESTRALNAELEALRETLKAQLTEAKSREEEDNESGQRLGLIESTLRQREEEIEQTRSELERMRDLVAGHETDLADARDRAAQLHQQLEEANAWVFTLAKDRQAAQAEAASLQNRLAGAMTQSARTEMQLDRIKAQIVRGETEKSALKAELEVLSQQAAEAREDLLNAEEEWCSSSQSDRERIAQQQVELSTITRLLLEAEQARAATEAERHHINAEKAALFQQIEDIQAVHRTEIENRQAYGQAELSAMAEKLHEAQEACAAVVAERDRMIVEKAALLHQIEDIQAVHRTEIESRQSYGQTELSVMAERLHEAERARAAVVAERDQVIVEKAALVHQIEDVRAMVSLAPEESGGHRQTAEVERGLAELVRESALLTQLLATAEETASLASSHRVWLGEVNAWQLKRPSWWSLLPAKMRRQREQASLQERGIFDTSAYLRLYPDVAAEGINPLHHYIAHGMAEGRKLTR